MRAGSLCQHQIHLIIRNRNATTRAPSSVTEIIVKSVAAGLSYCTCRWSISNSTYDECGDVCNMVSGGVLDEDNCTLTFNSTGKTVGSYYAAALMIEDFYDESTYTPFSSIPLQFLIEVVASPPCPLAPNITGSISEGSCTAIHVGELFTFQIIVEKGCPGTVISDIFTVPPLYMLKSSLIENVTGTLWSVTESWIPDATQVGSQVYCAVAVD
ncbi:unnamed protein product, partial [Didymodactylos carnosus]